MEEEDGNKEVIDGHDEKVVREEIFTKVVRAGKRTYFFDVKATRNEDFYLTITESKKRLGKEGKVFYEKHKIFLYKEDFEKFIDGLKDAVAYIEDASPASAESQHSRVSENKDETNSLEPVEFTSIEFDDLGEK